METKQASSQTFCGRCGFARSGHGFLPAACSGFVEKKPEKPRRLTLVEPSCIGCGATTGVKLGKTGKYPLCSPCLTEITS